MTGSEGKALMTRLAYQAHRHVQYWKLGPFLNTNTGRFWSGTELFPLKRV